MELVLKAVAGPLKDQIFPLKPGLTIGRQGTDIALQDAKVSSVHARIEPAESGQWVLIDNESKNGTRIGEERIDKVRLKPGLVFHIGDSSFEVLAGAEAVVQAPVKEKKKKYWYDVLADFLNKNKDAFTDRAKPLVPLQPALVLEFIRGVQLNSKWIIGYGPRKVGQSSPDLPIWEPGAPAVCFEIQPTRDGIMFKTDHPGAVQLNNQSVDSQILKIGDRIQVLETLIEVDFTE